MLQLCSDLELVTLGLSESGCKFAFSCPLNEGRGQICTLIHANLESQIPSLIMLENNQLRVLKSASKVGRIAKQGMATLRITGHIRPRRRRVTTYIRTCGAGGPFSDGATSLLDEI